MAVNLTNIQPFVQRELDRRANKIIYDDKGQVVFGEVAESKLSEQHISNYARSVFVRLRSNVQPGDGTSPPILYGGVANENGTLKGGFDDIYSPRNLGGDWAGNSNKPMFGIIITYPVFSLIY